MAGFFGFFDFNKEGPGVSKDQPKKSAFFLYFEILFRKFWGLVTVNLIYCIYFIPVLALCLLFINLIGKVTADNALLYLFCFSPVILLGPANAGITKVTRDFVREEPGFIWSDFHESFKKNWKQSIAVSIFQYIGGVALFGALSFYYNLLQKGGLYVIPFYLAVSLTFIFIVMQFYLQLMVVTLDLNLKNIFKNAVFLSILALGKNILAILVTLLLVAVEIILVYYSLASYAAMLLMLAFTGMLFFALLSYTINSFAFGTIKKFIIDPYYKQNPLETSEGVKQVLKSGGDREVELPEYVYENGRLIHRSIIEKEIEYEEAENENKEQKTESKD
ncbi:MAG TPA: YesL family protein [Clostridiales bacterium]|nr:YesL family protein [Clostridiales bacterium]